MSKGILYLIPSNLGEDNITFYINKSIIEAINNCPYFIVENLRSARRFLIKTGISENIDNLHFMLLNKHTDKKEASTFIQPLLDDKNVGIISEAGCPGVADPGAFIVKLAHKNNIEIRPLPGPSAILLALMASGLNGQNFAFNGYLPIEKGKRLREIKFLEQLSQKQKQTQIFIETPFRNNQLINDLTAMLSNETQLCIAANILQENAFIKTKSISEWKKNKPQLHKIPAVFLLLK